MTEANFPALDRAMLQFHADVENRIQCAHERLCERELDTKLVRRYNDLIVISHEVYSIVEDIFQENQREQKN